MRSKLLKNLIESKLENFSPGYKKLSHYLMENGDEAVFLTVREIARKLSISEAMVVRFAQDLGYTGFQALQDAMQMEFREWINMVAQMNGTIKETAGEPKIHKKVTMMEIEYLKRSIDDVSEENMEQAVTMLSRADRVFLFAQGSSCSLADILEFRLLRLGILVTKIEGTGRYLFDRLALMEKKDILVLIEFVKPTRDMQIALEIAEENKVKTILITDIILLKKSKNLVRLAARRGPVKMFHSVIVPMNIVNTLIIGTAIKMQSRSKMSLQRLDALLKKYRYAKLDFPKEWEQERMDNINWI